MTKNEKRMKEARQKRGNRLVAMILVVCLSLGFLISLVAAIFTLFL